MRDKLGICQWFHYEDYDSVERAVDYTRELGVYHLRTGISWADFHRPNGKRWYDWQMQMLAEFDVLLSIWHTPPSIAEAHSCAAPPRRLRDYSDFIGQVIAEYGEYFSHLELWNEPNNRLKWDFERYDPDWSKFGRMVAMAAETAHLEGKPTVLGGMIPIDHHWLQLMYDYGVLDAIDVVAIHGFPGMWWNDAPNWDWYQHWTDWRDKVRQISEIAGKRAVWITETGLATWDLQEEHEARFQQQIDRLDEAVLAPVDRVYWYSLIDLDPAREAIEGFHVDENEYHLGLVRWNGVKKPAWSRFRERLHDTEYDTGIVPSQFHREK